MGSIKEFTDLLGLVKNMTDLLGLVKKLTNHLGWVKNLTDLFGSVKEIDRPLGRACFSLTFLTGTFQFDLFTGHILVSPFYQAHIITKNEETDI